ncbi:MAG: plasmid mobilization relaxosome protein MobC [Sellimonas intestinalis]
MDDLVYQIRKIGVNINQITKKVNADKVYLRYKSRAGRAEED